MAIENVTVNMTVQKITFDNNAELYGLYDQLVDAGWFGAMANAKNLAGEVSPRRVSLTSPDGQVLTYDLSTVVALVNGAYVAMTEDEYQARYGTTS